MANILFLRSLPLERDARSTKMIAEYRKRGHHVLGVVWSRGDSAKSDEDTVICATKGGYGKRFRGLGARLRWICFLVMHMIQRRKDYEVVRVVDLDTGLFGVPLGRLLGKHVIYDAFDHIAAIVGSGLAGSLLAPIERLAIKGSSLSIFPDVARLEQYGLSMDETVAIIGNIPDLSSMPDRHRERGKNHTIRMVYIGTLERYHRGLEYLPDVCDYFGRKIEVVVGGVGELHDFFVSAASRIDNLTYLSHQPYDSALVHMSEADCLYGPYLLSSAAHRYAAPNKMYEHLALGKPLVTNYGTPPANLVNELGSGFLFDGTLDGLTNLLLGLDNAACEAAGRRALAAWHGRYSKTRAKQLASFFHKFSEIVG